MPSLMPLPLPISNDAVPGTLTRGATGRHRQVVHRSPDPDARRVTSTLMEQRPLGRTGLRVSRLGLGTLNWARDTDEQEAADQLKTFWEAGGTLVDTADIYADGGAEYLLGRLSEGLVPRDDLVIATKAGSV